MLFKMSESKFEADPRQPRYLQTVRGEGYMLTPD